jgi:hypothetical protein
MFAWHRPDIGHELTRVGEAAQIADFRDDGLGEE